MSCGSPSGCRDAFAVGGDPHQPLPASFVALDGQDGVEEGVHRERQRRGGDGHHLGDAGCAASGRRTGQLMRRILGEQLCDQLRGNDFAVPSAVDGVGATFGEFDQGAVSQRSQPYHHFPYYWQEGFARLNPPLFPAQPV